MYKGCIFELEKEGRVKAAGFSRKEKLWTARDDHKGNEQ